MDINEGAIRDVFKDELNNLTLADVDYHDGYLRIIEGKGKKRAWGHVLKNSE